MHHYKLDSQKQNAKSSNFVLIALGLALIATLSIHEMDWAESKCEELGNTPQQCALLAL